MLLCEAAWPNARLGSEQAVMIVESVVLAPTEPPPETLTAFTCGEAALVATFTVTVMAG